MTAQDALALVPDFSQHGQWARVACVTFADTNTFILHIMDEATRTTEYFFHDAAVARAWLDAYPIYSV